jgi:hypothetical protein
MDSTASALKAEMNGVAARLDGNASKADLAQLQAASKADLVQLQAASKSDFESASKKLKVDIDTLGKKIDILLQAGGNTPQPS